MALFFESIMLICFGVSWPISVIKDIRSKTAKGKSVFFICAIIIGYGAGIVSKILGHFEGKPITYVLGLYIFNLIMVSTDLCITIINKKRDEKDANN